MPVDPSGLLEQSVTKEQIVKLARKLLLKPQVEIPLEEWFGEGVYVRTVLMRKGTFIIGQEHKTSFLNNVFTGRAKLIIEGKMREVVAPAAFFSQAGVRKVAYIEEDMIWQTVHVTNETDPAKLKEWLINEDANFTDIEIAESADKLGLAIEAPLSEGLEHLKCEPTPISDSPT